MLTGLCYFILIFTRLKVELFNVSIKIIYFKLVFTNKTMTPQMGFTLGKTYKRYSSIMAVTATAVLSW